MAALGRSRLDLSIDASFGVCTLPVMEQISCYVRLFTMYHILLGWKTCEYYYVTDKLPNPRPTHHPRKNRLKMALGPLFPTANNFSWVWIGFVVENGLLKLC